MTKPPESRAFSLAPIAAMALMLTAPGLAQEAAQPAAPSPGEIVAQASAEEWIAIPAEDLLVMTLAPDAQGNAREVVIQLMPAPFSQGWVENIRTLARDHWYDGIAVTRVQDNYVVQWGDPNGEDPAKAKPLPAGLNVMDEGDYVVDVDTLAEATAAIEDPGDYRVKRAMVSISSTQTADAPEGWHERDSYADWVEIWHGWPLANKEIGTWYDKEENEVPAPNVPKHEAYGQGYYHDIQESWFWPVHCYGMVGVGRGYSPDTGTGAELYTVIGHAPRHLDRNIALVGRVVEGIEHLSSLPRGTGDLGFYEDPAMRVPIVSIRVASDLPEGEQPHFQYLSTEGQTFARYAEARANRRDPFFIVPAGGADICNIPVPVRRVG